MNDSADADADAADADADAADAAEKTPIPENARPRGGKPQENSKASFSTTPSFFWHFRLSSIPSRKSTLGLHSCPRRKERKGQ